MTKRMWVAVLGAAAMAAAPQLALAAPEPSRLVGIKLPEERLMIVAGNSMGAIFLAPDSIAWTGRSAVALVYTVLQPGRSIGEGKIVVEEVERKRFDCAAQTYQSLGSEGFDEAGQSIVWLPGEAPAPIKDRTMTSRLAKVVCGDVQLPPGNIVTGHVAAKALALQALQKKP